MNDIVKNIVGKAFSASVGKALLASALALSAGGCVNIMTRPHPNCKTEMVYQPTRYAVGLMGIPFYSDVPTEARVAMGILLPVSAVDVVCEAAIDTVLFPYDYFIAVPRYEREYEREFAPQYDDGNEKIDVICERYFPRRGSAEGAR